MPPERFLDAASGLPLHPAAREAWLAAAQDGWADPDRLYAAARRARLLLDAARESLADSLRIRADELSLTPSANTARHAAVLGALAGRRVGSAEVLVHSAVEHSAVLHAADALQAAGGRAVAVGVDATGRVDPDRFVAAIRRSAAPVAALQAGNHEVGTLQPIEQIAEQTTPECVLVVDAAHAVARVPLPTGWAVLVADARLWGGGPLGLLAVRTGTRWRSPAPHDEHERGRFPGLVDIPAAVAAAAGLRAALADRDQRNARLAALVARIRAEVGARIPDVQVLGDPVHRLPHIVTFSCLYVDGEALLTALDRRGFAVSSGSSCTSDTLRPSHVLVAMGALTSGNVRVSLSDETSAENVDAFLRALPEVVAEVRAELGAAGL